MKTDKHSVPITWDDTMELIERLLSDGNYRMALLIGCECYLGAQIKHLLLLTWGDLINRRRAVFADKQGAWPVDLRIGAELYTVARICYDSMAINDDSRLCFINNNKVMTESELRKELSEVRRKYCSLNIDLSVASLRKLFGRRVIQNAGDSKDIALVALCHHFNHLNPKITELYLYS